MRFVLLLLLLAACDLGLGGEDECATDDDCGRFEQCIPAFLFGGSECKPMKKAGEECAWSVTDCRPGLTCNYAYEPARCQKPKPFGGICDSGGDCADAEAICNRTVPDAASVCTLPGTVPEGGGCWNPAVCMPGLGCAMSVCSPPGGLGDWCSGHWPPDVPSCEEGLVCSVREQVCIVPGPEGTPCTGDEGCLGDLTCHQGYAAPVCSPRSGAGEPCGTPRDCVEGLVCGSAKACREMAPLGEPCGDDVDCEGSLQCVLEVCETWPLPLGAACEEDLHCGFDAFCDVGSCALKLPDGAPCDRFRQCEHACVDGACT